jgi:GPH family glycoside/pentoside/hexuronide:cation symporter
MSQFRTATRFEKMAYSAATFGNAMLGAVVSIFTFFYYKNVVYINLFTTENQPIIATLMGTALAIGWWTQALMNPVAGHISDKLASSRFGRRKPWLILGSPIMALSFIGIFLVPTPATDIYFPIIWLTIFITIFNAAFAATVVVYLSMIPAIAPTPEERTNISTYRTAFYLVGYILGALIGALLQVEDLVLIVVVVLSVLMLAGFYLTAIGVKEPSELPKLPTYSIREALAITFRNKPFLPYLGFTIFATMFQSMIIGALPDFGAHVVFKGDTENIIASFLPGAFVITAIIAVFPAMGWINRVGKKKATIYSLLIATIITPFLFTVGLIPGFELVQTLVVVLILGFPAAPLLILPDAIISDITDYDENVTGTRREAMHFASQGILTRFAGGISVQIMGIIIGFFGGKYGTPSFISQYIPGLPDVFGLMLIGPVSALFLIIGVFIFRKYPEEEVLEACAKKIAV